MKVTANEVITAIAILKSGVDAWLEASDGFSEAEEKKIIAEAETLDATIKGRFDAIRKKRAKAKKAST